MALVHPYSEGKADGRRQRRQREAIPESLLWFDDHARSIKLNGEAGPTNCLEAGVLGPLSGFQSKLAPAPVVDHPPIWIGS